MTIFNQTKQLDDFRPRPRVRKNRTETNTNPHAPTSVAAAEPWDPKYRQVIEFMSGAGHNPRDIALALGVRWVAFERWVRERVDVQNALAAGIARANADVEHSLFWKACGYTHPEEKIFAHNVDGEIVVTREETTKHYPPDTEAGKFWLKNRAPERWHDKQQVEHSGTIGVAEQMTDEQLESIAAGIAIDVTPTHERRDAAIGSERDAAAKEDAP